MEAPFQAACGEDGGGLWQMVLDGFPEGIVVVRQNTVHYANPAFAEYFGHPQTPELHGRSLDTLLAGLDPVAAASPREALGRRRDGSEFPVEYSLSALEVRGERWQVLVVRDVGERKRLERQYRDAQKMQIVARLVGGIVHDFNNLLTAVMIYAGMLLTRLPEGGRPHHFALEIQRASERGAALASQLLALARQQPLQPEAVDLGKFLAERRDLLQKLVGERIACRIECAPNLERVHIDPAQLDQVVLNLTANARDAMPEGGTLTLEVVNREVTPRFARSHLGLLPGRYVLLAVRDTGCGMEETTRAHLFEPFFTTKERGKGTGLGLTTVYGILAQAGGRIYLDSVPGKGTEVHVFLPAVAGSEAGPHPPRDGSPSVLLVEDEALVRESLQETLQEAGFRVLAAADGPHALRMAGEQAGSLAALITDMVMPGMSGEEVARKVLEMIPELPVIFISGYTAEAQFERMRAGGARCLQKPFPPRLLVDALTEAVAAVAA